jgi:hypothetical protein
MGNNIVSIVVGARGTGKTDFVKENAILKSPMKRKLVVDTFDSEPWATMETYKSPQNSGINIPILEMDKIPYWKTGLYRVISSDIDQIFSLIDEWMRNALLIFEDSTKYIEGKIGANLKKFVYDSKQKNLNLVFIFHSLAAVPPGLIRAADTLTIFKTNEGIPAKGKYPFPDIPQAMDIVRKSNDRYINITIRLN